MVRQGQRNQWYLVSSHGSVLFFIALNPGCTVAQIADGVSLTSRSVWGLVGDMRRAGLLHVQKNGRRHHYSANMDAPFIHPFIGRVPLRVILGRLAAEAPTAAARL